MKANRPIHPHDPIPPAIADAAAAWLARRDRGLTPLEQDDYMQWLTADPLHGEALSRHAATLERMMQLNEWQPAHDTEPNPDLFAPASAKSPNRPSWLWLAGLAAAAAAALLLWPAGRETAGPAPGEPVAAAAPRSHLHVNERMALPDGSRVELKDGSRVVVQYSEKERRVQLAGGEAQFSVWKDAMRPFIVEVAGVEVRAVGTAFNVRLGEHAVEVLVTEGRVNLAPEAEAGLVPATAVSAGERAIVPLGGGTPMPVVTPVTTDEITRELAWQEPRLQFQETPLREAIAEFNRLNRHQLVLGDPELGDRRIGGTFRPDNVDGFIRLLDTTLDIRAVPAGEGRTMLHRAR